MLFLPSHRYFTALGLLFYATTALAQLDTLHWSPGKQLQPSDFSIREGRNYIDLSLHYTYILEPVTVLKYLPVVTAQAIMNRSTSTLSDSMPHHLRYAQLLFDLEGNTTKQLKVRVLGPLQGSYETIKKALDQVYFEVSQETQKQRQALEQELDRSPDPMAVLEAWELKVQDLLRQTPDVLLEQKRSNWQVGCFLGVGTHIFSHNTKAFFTNPTSLTFGFEGDIRQSRLTADFALGMNKAIAHVQESKGTWPSGTRTHFAYIALNYGYKIPRKAWLWVPYAGWAINELTPAKTAEGDTRRLVGYGPVVGVEVGRTFKKVMLPREEVLYSYRLKFSVCPNNFMKDLEKAQHFGGTQFNLHLLLGMDSARLKKRLVYAAAPQD